MINVEFTEVEVNNLLAFLNTSQLVGKDVPAFVNILNKIIDSMEVEEEDD